MCKAVDSRGGGSSPLTRGKPFSLKSRHKQDAAHPRSRGENPYTASTDQDPKGSSPLTRGKRGERCHRSETSGLIPAHAGKTMTLSTKRPSSGAHPRSRGENSSRSGPGAIGRGSSPLTRGKPSSARNATQPCGLIPAHAGKTGPVTINALSARAHPRSRGENGHGRRVHLRPRGSSPLTRGKRSPGEAPRTRSRLIPAHAGKTR